ncbi:MAG TPA: MFS transporter [Syntrophaceae bacterium]|nr:MFS transporter [Syntrophaceae bacterium]
MSYQENGKGILGLHKNVFSAGLVSFFMDFSSEMVYPLVPLFLATILGVNKSIIGIIEGIAESTASLLKVFSGWFSDRIGKRRFLMVGGYGVSTLSRPFVALSTHWGHVLTYRFIDRFGKGIRTAPRDAIIAESSPEVHLGRSFGFHRAMDTVGAVVGPATAFLLLSLFSNSYRLVFWVSMIPGILAIMIIVLFITEKKGKRGLVTLPKLSLKDFDYRFKAFIFVITLFALGNSSDAFLILRAQNLGIKIAVIPLVYLSFNVVYALFAWPAGILSDKIGPRKVILSGFILFALIYLGFALAQNPTHIWMLFPLYGIFMGLTEGVQKAYLATIIPHTHKATAYGIYNSLIGLAVLPASIMGGYLWDTICPSATFYYGAIVASFSALLFIFLLKK